MTRGAGSLMLLCAVTTKLLLNSSEGGVTLRSSTPKEYEFEAAAEFCQLAFVFWTMYVPVTLMFQFSVEVPEAAVFVTPFGSTITQLDPVPASPDWRTMVA